MKQGMMGVVVASALSAGAVPAPAQPVGPEPSAGIVDRTVQVGARQVHHLRAGSGPTTIVLLHGWPQSSHEWRRVMPLLADRFTVVAPDLPGIGGSSGPAGGASAPTAAFEKAALARDVHAFVETFGARRVVLAGHDVGGMVAYAYLAGADRSMGSGEAELERGLRALGVRDIRVAVIPNSGHWIAEENPTATATVLATFAAGRR